MDIRKKREEVIDEEVKCKKGGGGVGINQWTVRSYL